MATDEKSAASKEASKALLELKETFRKLLHSHNVDFPNQRYLFMRVEPESVERRSRASPSGQARRPSLQLIEGVFMEPTNRWHRSMGSYEDNELRAVRFKSVNQCRNAIRLIAQDRDLKGLPYDPVDGRTLVLPADAVSILRSKGLQFVASKLLDRNELKPSELAEMRRAHGM